MNETLNALNESTLGQPLELSPVGAEELNVMAETTALDGLRNTVKPFGAELAHEVVGVTPGKNTSAHTTTVPRNDSDRDWD